jgi:glycosyltransferase involved in cell wall biosynthesis
MIRRLKQSVVDRLGITRLAQTADAATAAAAEAERGRAELADRVIELEDALQRAAWRADHASREQALRLRIVEHTTWSARAPLRRRPTIAIVLATRDRAALLPAALESVHAQLYDKWQLVIVDDGSTDETPALLRAAASTDPRITVEHTEGVGAAAARNAGLARTDAEWVTFLDDDNALHPAWLRAIAEYSGRVEGCRALFGAQLREDPLGDAPLPRMWFEPAITLEQLRVDNAIDLGALAVRRDHPELRFDETLERYIDWELIVRLADSSDLDPLPVVASLYTMRAAGSRISDRDEDAVEQSRLLEMRRRLAGG